MEFFNPEQCIGDQEIADFIFSKVKHFCSPVRMFSKSWICIFIRRSSVKISKSMCVLREMGRYPVQNDTDLISMQIIDHPCEIFRCSIPGCRCIITSHLISPGTVKRMLRDPHQLHMCITHFFNIFGNCSGKLSICIETFIFPSRMAHPGTNMCLIDRHRLMLMIPGLSVGHPFCIRPFYILDICNSGCCSRS